MMVPQAGETAEFFHASVHIRGAAEPLSKRLKDSGTCPRDVTFVPTVTFSMSGRKNTCGEVSDH